MQNQSADSHTNDSYELILLSEPKAYIINRNLTLFEPVILSEPKTYSTTTANWFTNIQLFWVDSFKRIKSIHRGQKLYLLTFMSGSVEWIKNIQSNLYSPIPKQMILMIRLFLVNQKYAALPVLLWFNYLTSCWKRVHLHLQVLISLDFQNKTIIFIFDCLKNRRKTIKKLNK